MHNFLLCLSCCPKGCRDRTASHSEAAQWCVWYVCMSDSTTIPLTLIRTFYEAPPRQRTSMIIPFVVRGHPWEFFHLVGSDRRGTSHSRPWSRKITSQSSELTAEIATSVRHFQAAEVAAGLGSKNNKKRQASKNNKIDIRDDTQHHLSSSWRLFSSQSSPDRRQQSIKYFKQFFIHIISGEAHCFQLHPLRLQFVLHHLFFSFCCPLPEAPWPCPSDWHWHIQGEVFTLPLWRL